MMISIKNLHIQFGSETVFKEFNLSVQHGENLVLLGASGSGKSSILHSLLGFVKPVAGEIMVDGLHLSPANIHKIRRKTAWVPQELNLQLDCVRDLFFEPFQLQINKKNKPSDGIVYETLGVLGLDPTILNKKLNEISGGQKQRLLIAASIMLRKPLLILDEPSSALDADSVDRVADLILRQKGVTVLSCSHDQKWIKHCDRIVELKK